MNIEQYISDLLYRYQCVAVPGFGAFITENQSAQLLEDGFTFLPPRKVISFNAHIKSNDGLLANHIAITEKISFEQAVRQILDYVERWKTVLNSNHALTLNQIGTLKLTEARSYIFEPITTVNYLTSSFGLAPMGSIPIQRAVLKEAVEALEEQVPVLFTPERKRTYSYLKYAASIVLFLGLAGSGVVYYKNQIAQKTIAVQKSVETAVQQKIQEATFVIALPKTAETPVEESTTSKPYHIVAGVFSKAANAETAYQDLVKKGFNAEKGSKNKKGMYPVYFQSFASYEEAQKFLENLRKDKDNPAWLLVD